jgi:hypothetical protein
MIHIIPEGFQISILNIDGSVLLSFKQTAAAVLWARKNFLKVHRSVSL